MARFCIFLVISALVWGTSYSAAVFDANKCTDGCKTAHDCPTNAHCVPVGQNANCGVCMCETGYHTQDRQCVPNEKSKQVKSSDKRSGNDHEDNGNHNGNNNGNNGNGNKGGKSNKSGGSGEKGAVPGPAPAPADITTTAAPTTTTPSGPTTQGPPPGPIPINCADYACAAQLEQSSDDNPLSVRSQILKESPNCKRKINVPSRQCNLVDGPGVCYGVHCLNVEPGKDYCICPLYRVDRQCAVDKPGSCESATGQLPANGYRAQNKRYRNKNNPDNGSVYGRHFASSFDDCVKLCQWSGGQCRSVNFGTMAGQPICELLSVIVFKGGITEQWLVDAPGWQYAQVVSGVP